ILDSLFFMLSLAAIGAFKFTHGLRFQHSLRLTGILNSKKLPPRLKSFKRYVDDSISLNLDILGIDPEVFEKKRGIIESTFGLYFHDFKRGRNPRYGQLRLTPKTLPLDYPFEKAVSLIKRPYRAVIGMGMGGPIIESIEDWPHGLIAGSTGSGKSVQMKSIVAQFLHSSPDAAAILCDLKGGVEFGIFDGLANVNIHSEIGRIAGVLERVVVKMEERFKLMREKKVQKIDPKLHKCNFIFIVVDEASLLYRRVPKNHPEHLAIEKARSATQKILKLGRAAKISVLFGLQRPSKESIDTEIQENIDARICFKINTVEGSIRMLGHKNAVNLPSVAGRGIWKMGNDERIFQGPLITDSDIRKLKIERNRGQEKKESGPSPRKGPIPPSPKDYKIDEKGIHKK
ncbi:MAG: FtsK/SpoIIIE domain-containing protein, partial [Bacteriovoracales bacterium]|nr:FtsK/SpoIIIE domain-containing protein [Bacteriovoracales bacterium]